MTDWLNTSDLRIGYAQGKALAGPLDIAFHPGELVCLVGPNGSGKSTLLRTLAGLLPALSGNVLLQGSLLPDLSLAERARRVALVPSGSQAPQGMSAMDSVALGRSPHTGWWGKLSAKDREIVQSALLQTDCSALAQRKISELSDGERQRLSVARALAQEARMLLLDEPTAFLDLPHRVSLMGLLRTLCREQDLGVLLST
ncbi:MAG TPA: ABC transporter ATP-binding protein, partial [Fibrobacteraceae bacterium]|nr:ABC transporter ATP-binding protein [Fibrobacteraceae bacterium]